MTVHKLRIAWSVFFGVLAVLFCVLWVRSYWTLDFIYIQNAQAMKTTIGSEVGHIYIAHFNARRAYNGASNNSEGPHGWRFVSREPVSAPGCGFYWKNDSIGQNLELPHWSLGIVMALTAASVWLPWRFSLRTLLIFTTLISVAFGSIICFARN